MKRFAVLMLIVLAIVMTGCIDGNPGEKQPTEFVVSDFETVSKESPAYVVKALNDEAMVSMIKEMSTIMTTTSNRMTQQQNFSARANTLADVLEQLATFITSHEEAYQTLQEINTMGQTLRARSDRYDIQITLEEAAKTKMLSSLSEIMDVELTTDNDIVIDYRDLSFMIYASELLCMYVDNYTELIELIEELQAMSGTYPIKQDFFNIISTLDPTTLDLTQEGTWNQLETIWGQIVAISSPVDKLRLNDLFVEGVLTIPEFEVVLDYMNLAMTFVLDVYDFEVAKTDTTGHTTYMSLYQMLMDYGAPKEDITLFKTALNHTLSDLDGAVSSKRGTKPLLRDIEETIIIKLNNVEITENTKFVTILKALKPNFFKGLIQLEVSFSDVYEIPIEEELFDDNIEFSVSYTVNILLTELSGLSSSQSNLAIDEGLFDILMDNQIWNLIVNPMQIDETLFNTILSGISQNIAFMAFDQQGLAININAGNSNEMDMSIEFENYTMWELFQLALGYF